MSSPGRSCGGRDEAGGSCGQRDEVEGVDVADGSKLQPRLVGCQESTLPQENCSEELRYCPREHESATLFASRSGRDRFGPGVCSLRGGRQGI